MSDKTQEETRIYTYPILSKVSREKMISVNKIMSQIYRNSRNEAKRDTCWICNNNCSSFCHSHSIPRLILKNIEENSEVSAPRQADNLEPHKNTAVESAGVFFNICNTCDSKYFQVYEDENILQSEPTDKMLNAIALKNYLKVIYDRSLEISEEKVYASLGISEIVSSNGLSPAEYTVKSIEKELKYALDALLLEKTGKYHLCYRKELNYVVPYAAQYSIAMLADLYGNVINNFYTGSSTYKLEYLHISIFPLQHSSVILIFCKNGEKRHRRFIKQLKKLDNLDQLSVINFLTFTGAENVYINKTTYSNMVQNPIFMAACRLTYSIQSNVPKPSKALEVAIRAHSFEKRYALPNLLAPQYALTKGTSSIDEKKP